MNELLEAAGKESVVPLW